MKMKLPKGKWVIPVAALLLALSIGSAAFAATNAATDASTTAATDTSTAGVSTTATTTATGDKDGSGTQERGQRTDETLLTGTTAEQVKAAALAEVGSDATVERVETDADGNAAYEAHVVKADGTHVTVYVDESFKVVSVEERAAGGHGGKNGAGTQECGQRSDETLLTGTTADQVKAPALTEVGSDATVERVETDADGNAAYEAHVVKADGTHVTVYVDESSRWSALKSGPRATVRAALGAVTAMAWRTADPAAPPTAAAPHPPPASDTHSPSVSLLLLAGRVPRGPAGLAPY